MIGLAKNLYNKYLRQKQRLNQLGSIGKPTFIETSAVFRFNKNINIGKFCRIGKNCHIDGEGGVEIGDGTILAPNVVILSSSHNYDQDILLPYDATDVKRKVVIGKGCWIGWGVMIVPGVTIGDGVVVAMGSVVTKDVSSGSIIGGNPAKVIKERVNNHNLHKLTSDESYYIKSLYEGDLLRRNKNEKNNINILK